MTKGEALIRRLADVASAILRPMWQDERSRHADPAAEIRGMKWASAELLLAEAFRYEGFWVKEIGGESADLVLKRQSDDSIHLVDCRYWRSAEVGSDAVGKLYAAMGLHGAKGGFVVTAGTFSPEAIDFARGLQVELIGGRRLAGMLEIAKETASGALPITHAR